MCELMQAKMMKAIIPWHHGKKEERGKTKQSGRKRKATSDSSLVILA